MTLAALLAVSLLYLIATISPGPTVLVAARTDVIDGLRTGTFLAFGIGMGAVTWAIAALYGLAIVFPAAPALFWSLKILGGFYLLYMAWGLWRDSAKPFDTAQSDRLPRAAFSAFGLGLGTQLTNPKPAFLFSAIFIAAVQPDTPIWVYGVLFAMVFLNEASWNILVARIFSFDRTRAGYINLKTIIDRAFGGMLALLGFKIAAT